MKGTKYSQLPLISKGNLQAFCYPCCCVINSEQLPFHHLATELDSLFVLSRLSDLIYPLFNDPILTFKFMEDFSVLIIANITIKIPTFLLLENETSFSKTDAPFGKILYFQLINPTNLVKFNIVHVCWVFSTKADPVCFAHFSTLSLCCPVGFCWTAPGDRTQGCFINHPPANLITWRISTAHSWFS